MAGILANSPTKTMVSGDTSANNAVSGYLSGETITLTATPAGSSYSWSLARPSDSTARADLSALTGDSVTIKPDAEGYYVVTANVDGTTYVLRIAVANVGTVSDRSILRLSPLADSQVPTPALGVNVFYSSTQDSLAFKDAAGDVFTIDSTAV